MHEAREAIPPTIFFFVGFNFIVFTTNLLLADYAIAVSSFMLATVLELSLSAKRCWSPMRCRSSVATIGRR